MKNLKSLTLIFVLFIAAITSISAQTKFEVPQNVELKIKEDYARYETDMINAAKWLEETDLDKENVKRKEVSKFAMQWIMGCPTFNIDITEQLAKIYGKNTDLLLLYMASYSRYFLENKATATKSDGTKAGLLSIMAVYKKGILITKSKEMDKLIKITDDGKLDDYIKDKFKD